MPKDERRVRTRPRTRGPGTTSDARASAIAPTGRRRPTRAATDRGPSRPRSPPRCEHAHMPSVSAQFSIILRVEIDHRPGMLGRVATAIGDAGGSIGSVDLIGIEGGHTLRDITIETAGEDHAIQIGQAVDQVDGARTVDITDRTFQMHVG